MRASINFLTRMGQLFALSDATGTASASATTTTVRQRALALASKYRLSLDESEIAVIEDAYVSEKKSLVVRSGMPEST